MPNYNKQISSLTGGVSQQPDSLRFDNQAKEQINFFSSASKGIIKRFPTDYIADIPNVNISSNVYSEFVEFPNGKRFALFIDDRSVSTYDIDSDTYIEHISPSDPITPLNSYFEINDISKTARDSFRTLVVGDNLLILNNTVNVGDFDTFEDPNLDSLYESLVYCRTGNYGKTYKIIVNVGTGVSVSGTYTTPIGDDSTDSDKIDTSFIMTQLITSLSANITTAGLDTKITVEQKQNIALIKNLDKDEGFNVTTVDGFDDRALYAINNKIRIFSDLPAKAPDGFRCEVTGSEEGNFSAGGYWVTSKKDGEESSEAYSQVEWTESNEPGSGISLDSNKLPVRLGFDDLLNFDVYNVEYDDKEVGTDKDKPSFVNSEIQGMFYWKNRLGYFTSTDIIMSESGNVFNFYPTSIATSLTGDPIDIELNLKDSSNLKYAVPWQEQLLLFSDRSQAVLTSEGGLTTTNLSASEATSFLINDKVSPVLSGSSVFFPMNNNQFTEVREYFLINLANQKDASNITAHIPTYIPSNIDIIIPSNDARSVMMVSEEDRNSLYVYNYLWNGESKIMSSWNKYVFSEDLNIISIGTYEDEIYMVVQNPLDSSDIRLIRTKLTDAPVDNNGKFLIHLDYRVLSSDTSKVDNGDGTFTYTLPYDVVDKDNFIAVDYSNTRKYGGLLDSEFISDNEIKVSNSDDNEIILGFKYESIYRIGTVSMKSSDGQGAVSITSGRTHLLKMIINFSDTVEFKMRSTVRGRITRESSYHGRRKGTINSIFGEIIPNSDKFVFSVNQKNDTVVVDVIVDSHLPASFQFIDTVLRVWSTVGQRVT